MIHFTVPLTQYDWKENQEIVLISIYNDIREKNKQLDYPNLREYLKINHPRLTELSKEIWQVISELDNNKRKLYENN
ncbi:MAG: hypothetical protein Q8933_13460 [Bacteroidota bacterium]|jgi:hypothetical protein|nr:hypothetical protein [Bacteroidota bacterium]MDP4190279.1 hypothetical protein [Bacteroidota bacterium]MDP4194280.1 hypothetical protein [Bacteroidota bacterium]